MMDISSQTHPTLTVDIGPAPLSLWLRIAGHYRTHERDSVEYARLRTILDFEFILNLEGRTWMSIEGGGSVDIRPGDVVFLPPGYRHGWAYRTGVHRAVHFDFHANPSLRAYDNLQHTSTLVPTQPPKTAMPLFEIAGGDRAGITIPLVTPVRHPGLWSERMTALAAMRLIGGALADAVAVIEALGWMIRTVAEDAKSAGITESGSQNERLLTLIRELDGSAERDAPTWPTVAEMARRVDLGETAFRAAFRRVTGRAPRDYVEEQRIGRAKHLLIETDRSVKAIALSEGYDDAYHFSRVFKRVTGLSPTAFRGR